MQGLLELRFGRVGDVVTRLGMATPALASVVALFVSMRLHRVAGPEHDYVFLGAVAALLYYVVTHRPLASGWHLSGTGWGSAGRAALAWVAVVLVLILAGHATGIGAAYPPRVIATWFVLTPLLVITGLLGLRQALLSPASRMTRGRSVVIAGITESSVRLGKALAARPELGLRLEGYFDDRTASPSPGIAPSRLLGRFAELPRYVRRRRIDVIFVATPISSLLRTEHMLHDIMDTAASLYFVPDVTGLDLVPSRLGELHGVPIVTLCESPSRGPGGLSKRLFDIGIAATMLLLTMPIMVGIALVLARASSHGVLFRQRRYGLDGREFVVYKFRTMTSSDDGARVQQAARDDPRVTPFGRFLRRYSLDELPQLFNVLEGTMSLVGPRPHAVAHNEEYRKLIGGYMMRHKVLPGLTGLAQIRGCHGQAATVDEMRRRLMFDLEYLRRWSLLLDVEILLRTFAVVLRRQSY
jgi:putative colanic acid biosynthesis UDP-glucose lipid carrier transferase